MGLKFTGDAKAADAKAKQTGSLWYAFDGIGRAYLIKPGTNAASDADVSSVHGYPTIEAAVAAPNSKGTIAQATITQWNLWASLPVGGGVEGVMETVNVSSDGSTKKVSSPQNPTAAAADNSTGLSDVLGFLSGLTSANLWIRVAKVIGGGVVLMIGLVKLTGLDAKASGIVKTAVKVAPLL